MSESPPPGIRMRYMPGHLGSARILGSSLGCLSVTLCGFCPADISMVAVTLRTASVATLGRVAATLIGVPRPRARCAATRQRGLQKRAVERWGLNCEPQAEQVALTTPPRATVATDDYLQRLCRSAAPTAESRSARRVPRECAGQCVR